MISLDRILPVAVLSGLSLLPSARADSLICAYSMDEPYVVETGTDANGNPLAWPFHVVRGSVASTVQVVATVSNPEWYPWSVQLKSGTAETDSAAVVLSRETIVTDGEDTAAFELVAVYPGEADVTVSIHGDDAATLTFHVVVNEGETDSSSRITLSPDNLSIDEGSTDNRFTVTLGSAPASDKRLRVSWTGGVWIPDASYSYGDYYITIPAGATQRSFSVFGEYDGDFLIRADDPAGQYQSATLRGFVVDKPRRVSASTDPENPMPWPHPMTAHLPATFSAADVGASDADTLTYRWSFAPDDPSDPYTYKTWTNVWPRETEPGRPQVVWCDVDDGTTTVRCFFSVAVDPLPDEAFDPFAGDFGLTSGDADDDESSWIETSVRGAGTLSFDWKVSCENRNDSLQLLVDGKAKTRITGETDWRRHSLELDAGPHVVRWLYAKNKIVSEGEDLARLAGVVWTPAELGFEEALETGDLRWTTDGDAGWIAASTSSASDGEDCAWSGRVGNNGLSRLSAKIAGPGVLSFDWTVSGRNGVDWLDFFVDGEPQMSLTGEVPWERASVEIGEGVHAVSWEWFRSESDEEDAGLDQAGLDRVSWTGNKKLTIATESLPDGTTTEPYAAAFDAIGGTPPYRWSASEPAAPVRRASTFEERGEEMDYDALETGYWGGWVVDLPFPFPYFGRTYDSVTINGNGSLSFGPSYNPWEPSFGPWFNPEWYGEFDSALFFETPGIAVFCTAGDSGLFVEQTADAITIRWAGQNWYDGSAFNVSATLRSDGGIVLSYGEGNTGYGFVAFSAGDGSDAWLIDRWRQAADGTAELLDYGNAEDIVFNAVGALPPGLRLSEDGVLSGTPLEPGRFGLDVRVEDSAGQSVTNAFAVGIAPGELSIATETLPAATVGKDYAAKLAIVGGTKPYFNNVAENGSWPNWMAWRDGPCLGGWPEEEGVYTIDVLVTDWNTNTVQKRLYVTVANANTATATTPVPVPYEWLDEYYHGLSVDDDYEAAAKAKAANGIDKVWECYVNGVCPTNAAERFEARIGFENGGPVVSWTPDLNEGGTKSERVYTVEGKTNLVDRSWGPTNDSTRFFRVKVSMP